MLTLTSVQSFEVRALRTLPEGKSLMPSTTEKTLREFLIMDPRHPDTRTKEKILHEQQSGLACVTLTMEDGTKFPDILVQHLRLCTAPSLVYYWGTGEHGYGILTREHLRDMPLDLVLADPEMSERAAAFIDAAFWNALRPHTA